MNNEPIIGNTSAEQPRYQRASAGAKRRFLWIGLAIIGFDQFTKWTIESNIPLNTSYAPFPALDPYFRLSHIANRGTAWGLFDNVGLLFTVLAMIVTLGLLYFNFSLPLHHPLLRVALALAFGGAVGNLIDRLRLGYVTDFVNFNFYPLLEVPRLRWLLDFPIFNVADWAITTGVGLLAYLMWREGDDFPRGTPLSAETTAADSAE
jgi:signal peptidase II